MRSGERPVGGEVQEEEQEKSAKVRAFGSDVWVGGGAILCPGVSVGVRSVLGAGSVVTRDIPADVFAAGNPARVIRSLASADSKET